MTAEPGDLLLVRGSGPLQRIIEFATSSPYCHVGMLTPQGDLVEAKEFHGIRRVPVSAYPKANWYRVQCSPEQRLAAVAWALQRVGESYGWLQVAHDWNRPLVGAELTRRLHLAPVDCSGLVCYSYSKAGFTITRRSFASPADISWSVATTPL